MKKNDETRKKMKKFGYTDDFQGLPLLLKLFSSKSSTISMILFRNVSLFPEENQQPVLGGHRFSKEKCQFSLDLKQKTHFSHKKTDEKSLRSAPLSIIIHLEKYNHSTTTTGVSLTGLPLSCLPPEEPQQAPCLVLAMLAVAPRGGEGSAGSTRGCDTSG